MGLFGGKLPAVAVAILMALFIASCGGGDDDSTGSDSTAVAQGQEGTTGESDQTEGSSKSGASGESRDDSSGSTTKEHDDSGGGSAQFKTKGGDNSVQEFGEEASEPEFEQAAEAVHGFLDARAEEDWKAVCANLSGSVVKGIKRLIGKSKKAAGSCAKTMETVFASAPESAFKGDAGADVGSLRVEGDRAFAIYRNAEDEVLAISMKREDGGWKVATLAGTPLN